MKLLILHGPNMNLFGIRSLEKGTKITLDKINRHIRRFVRNQDIDIKIIQTHDEVKAVSYLHKNRNKFAGLIITPGVWKDSAYLLKDTLDIIKLNYVIINIDKNEKNNLLKGKKIIFNEDIMQSFEDAISFYNDK